MKLFGYCCSFEKYFVPGVKIDGGGGSGGGVVINSDELDGLRRREFFLSLCIDFRKFLIHCFS